MNTDCGKTAAAVGFDLDLTLFDTRPAIRAVLRSTSAALRFEVDVDRVMRTLGPPLEDLLAEQLPVADARTFAALYRADYAAHGHRYALLLPGVREAIAAVRGGGERVIVVTGQSERTARAHLTHERLEADTVTGSVWGPGKTEVLVSLNATVYIGDHPADIAAARAAGAYAVAVTTGRHGAGELAAADLVLTSLHEFARWWEMRAAPFKRCPSAFERPAGKTDRTPRAIQGEP
ncbi:HAD family hydrolase [Winogradskya humida]|uniref:Hydrolase n=1 Tax=Winogradskya humida TaxID=113566 RepID=A0ABQ4A2H7_9ACTN|nr:HAD hydrolase-like protein [Actinoplanes humidus]GIE24547.1 hydrolase [Actinoplanes humidus]